jgi:hypothetical protein
MSYYTMKSRALLRVDQLLAKGVPLPIIYFKIETEYGFSSKFVDDRIKRVEEVKELYAKENQEIPQQEPAVAPEVENEEYNVY